MKKTLLLSVVASTMIMAGGDIAPVEPVVEAPAPVAAASSDAQISGTAKLFYGTTDQEDNFGIASNVPGAVEHKMFNQDSSIGDVYADLKYTRKLKDNVTLNAGIAGISTLGLENELVASTWISHGPALVNDVVWINEANIVVGMPSVDSFVKIGRQELDTPFFYSETWNIAANTFDAAVLGNTSLPDTTLVAAWVGRGNGGNGALGTTVNLQDQNFQGGHQAFGSANDKPAYAAGIINKSLDNTTLQAWGYKIPGLAKAYWLQGDTNIAGIDLGAQYASAKPTTGNRTNAWAVKLGYGMDDWSVYGAYSKRNDKAGIDIANIATGGESKLYTEAVWNYGAVGAQDAKAYKLGGSYDLGVANIGAQYTNVKSTALNAELQEFAVTTSTKVGPVNADLAYVYDNKGPSTGGSKTKGSTALITLSLPYSL